MTHLPQFACGRCDGCATGDFNKCTSPRGGCRCSECYRAPDSFGAELLVRSLAQADAIPSGYLRLHGKVWHISDVVKLARAAVEALEGGRR